MKPALLVENTFLQNETGSQPVSSGRDPFGATGTGMNRVVPQTQTELSSQICGLKAASGGCQEKFTPKGSSAISTSQTRESR